MSESLTVRYFAAAAEAAGAEEERISIEVGSTLDDLRSRLVERYGAPMAKVLRGGSFLVNGRVRTDGGPITAGDRSEEATAALRVDVLPPFAGG